MIITLHNAGALHRKFSDFALCYIVMVLIHDSGLPAEACLADGADFVDILNAEMYAARSDGFGKSVVGIVFVMR